MSAKSKSGKVLSRRENPETGELEIYEMTPEEAEEAINHLLRALEDVTQVSEGADQSIYANDCLAICWR